VPMVHLLAPLRARRDDPHLESHLRQLAVDGAKDLTSVPLVVFAVNYFWNANLELRPGTGIPRTSERGGMAGLCAV
jgi:hypothetical protein